MSQPSTVIDNIGRLITNDSRFEVVAGVLRLTSTSSVALGTTVTVVVTATDVRSAESRLQLLYELGTPAYANPDVTTRMDSIVLADAGSDRVSLSGVRGAA